MAGFFKNERSKLIPVRNRLLPKRAFKLQSQAVSASLKIRGALNIKQRTENINCTMRIDLTLVVYKQRV